ncbi:hypothetical protein [Spirosoma radiotolerans]|uniref:hypothetical protein n=1 Tax=Spirosoma radiotolerans TaxID=1379870 RepID=UPI000627180F|nr:hypothetical protein [Spirosoma radiotolerans]
MSTQPGTTRSAYTPEPLPAWLADEDSLRDEGVLFGLSEARPDGKVAQIRAFFARQTAPFDEMVDESTERIGELNLFIEQRENRITTLRDQINELLAREPRPNNLIRTVVSLVLSLGVCVCNFYLIDETLRPLFPNRLIAVGVFLAGMFNLFSRTSFLYEDGPQLSVRRILAETGLPLAASVFVLVQALQSQSTGQAIALFSFVFFLFLLAGNLFLSNLVALQTALANIDANRQSIQTKAQRLPGWQAEIDRLNQEVDTLRIQKWPLVTALNHTQAQITQLNTRRDELVNLFVSEFELARSLRDRLSEQQRNSMLNYE